jgi:hypothetical protein
VEVRQRLAWWADGFIEPKAYVLDDSRRRRWRPAVHEAADQDNYDMLNGYEDDPLA